MSETASPDIRATAGHGAMLVRPDGVVGWRSAAPEESAEHELEDALRRLLSIEAGES